MNIFALYPSPQESARAHCDQHLHKMLLESAQMASTTAHLRNWKISGIYKPAYETHPCTQWALRSVHNLSWLLELAKELAVIRDELNCPSHSSSEIIKLIHDYIHEEYPICMYGAHSLPALAMPLHIRARADLDPYQKYQQYYREKNKQWALLDKRPMTWKNRPVPSFMNLSV